ncbi:UV excision repair protein rhp23 [Penicillium macrosclerotiorum]|uniref:UV excision repair protein rhp23 n=1 Tax=Penicillium macrosclerotiorum TaxID=303699 RepID=UPI002547EA55|nr:UV excision repair protein rhp23 [Penicillium macrosclerotiorum]KAJ5693401.1 UV excision repair protein rhp23 [Penicillium macrosclerotiorum]
MKLTFKDLKQEKFVIEVEPSETVRQVKEKIAQEKEEYAADRMKVIYSGKILQDDKTVESYNIQEKDFLVCLPAKQPKASSSAASSAPSTPAARAPASTPAAPAPAAPAPAARSNPAVPATPSPAGAGATQSGDAAAFGDPSALAMGAAAEGAMTQMEAMGFERPMVERAMRAAFFNPDRAIDYLLNGIPESVQQEQQQRQQQQEQQQQGASLGQTAAATGGSTGGGEPYNMFEAAAQAGDGGRGARSAGTGGADAASLDFLRSNPHFQQLRQLVQQQPTMLEPILQQVAQGNPQIAQLISQNSEAFLQLLGEDIGDEDEESLPPGAQVLSVTEEERDAIERLCRLGFPRDSVIQAYFACDKNEELAANFLFDQPDDDEE